ncbi:hypothetical protein [Acetobacteroides hydrogenigenes]|uniref:Uncharacterized protein n=1 Tax=Acetobacteroides hydrogenigenes TaxID=979970 RepID=A0A4R2F544_9BACT|nr:hypothetical protein [Acetobacteroides hydrogenigenes]TCN72279.1 hypothetical protein CLV25_102245 [Acetobacteroides hydrogenigenes]
MNLFRKLAFRIKPGVPKRYLLLVAAVVWTFAGGMLLGKGASYLMAHSDMLLLRLIVGVIFGVAFFWLLFMRISLKHINRIRSIDVVRPCIFSFFDFKSYLMMGGMVSMGIALRHLNFINKTYLFNFYVAMGVPLLLSAVRFLWAWVRYHRVVED